MEARQFKVGGVLYRSFKCEWRQGSVKEGLFSKAVLSVNGSKAV